MPVSFPERTLEQWFAGYVLARYPKADLWAPTQNDEFNWDAAFGNGKLFIFECKTCFSNRLSTRVDIDTNQLGRYLDPAMGPLRDHVYYLCPIPDSLAPRAFRKYPTAGHLPNLRRARRSPGPPGTSRRRPVRDPYLDVRRERTVNRQIPKSDESKVGSKPEPERRAERGTSRVLLFER